MKTNLKFKKPLIAFVYAMLVAVLFTGCNSNRYKVTQRATTFNEEGIVLTTLWDDKYSEIIIMKSDKIEGINPKLIVKRKKELDSIAGTLNSY
jgi:hypothetical protein